MKADTKIDHVRSEVGLMSSLNLLLRRLLLVALVLFLLQYTKIMLDSNFGSQFT